MNGIPVKTLNRYERGRLGWVSSRLQKKRLIRETAFFFRVDNPLRGGGKRLSNKEKKLPLLFLICSSSFDH